MNIDERIEDLVGATKSGVIGAITTKQKIKQLIKEVVEEVIGEDEKYEYYAGPDGWPTYDKEAGYRNDLRAEQRKKLAEYKV